MLKRTISFLVVFCLFLEQCFAQVAVPLNLSAALSGLAAGDKFRPMQMRSLIFNRPSNDFDLLVDKGDVKKAELPEIQGAAANLMEYFQVGISLPESTFWVNLRPDRENEVIDPLLATTDLGKVMLEADVTLKKDLANATSPDTAQGKKYWNKLYAKAEMLFGKGEITIPTLTRPWIVPGEIVIRQAADSAYIYKATLKVQLEQDYLHNSAAYNFDDPRLKELNEYSSSLIKELIIPGLTKKVNSAKTYASLRQVYYSLILAKWFKKHFQGTAAEYANRINTNNLIGLTSKTAWSKSDYFNAYRKSFNDGEYNTQENIPSDNGMTVRKYTSGGVVLAGAEIETVLNPVNVAGGGDLSKLPGIRLNTHSLVEVAGSVQRHQADGGIFAGTRNLSKQLTKEIEQLGQYVKNCEIVIMGDVKLEKSLRNMLMTFGFEDRDIRLETSDSRVAEKNFSRPTGQKKFTLVITDNSISASYLAYRFGIEHGNRRVIAINKPGAVPFSFSSDDVAAFIPAATSDGILFTLHHFSKDTGGVKQPQADGGTEPVKGLISLKKGDPETKWWEQATLKELRDRPTPWGDDQIVAVDKQPGVMRIRLTKEMLADYDEIKNPGGRQIERTFVQEEKIGPQAIAGIRHKMNVDNVHDTRMIKNSVERMLTGISLALMVKIMYNKGAGFPYQANYGHEVRYHSDTFQAIMARTLAAFGFVVHVVPDDQATAIWNTSTMGKFFNLVLSFCGTSSHAPSDIDGLKIMDYEGSQFLIKPILAMLAIKRALIEKIKKDGYVDFYLSAKDDPRITDQLYKSTNNGMTVYKKYQQAAAADEFILSLVKSVDTRKLHIDCAHGSAYRTLTSFFKEMGLEKLNTELDWMHTEERADFGNIGKLKEHIDDPSKAMLFDMGADVTQVKARVVGNDVVNFFPVLATGDYPERFRSMPIGHIILHTDMDNDRLAVSQILPNTDEVKESLRKNGVIYNVLDAEKIVAVFIPNKFFHMLHEMNFRRIAYLMEQGQVDKNRTLVVLTTLASTPAVSEWAEARKKEGYKVEVVNTAVGFAKLANVMYRSEGFMRQHPGKDVIITDARGMDINLGPNPLLIASWEESGGIITGITFEFRDLLGNTFMAEREKSATESIFLSLALISQLQKGNAWGYKGEANLAEYMNYLYVRDNIKTPIDMRYDYELGKPGSPEEKEGNIRKTRIFGAYLAIAINFMKHRNNPAERRVLLEEAKTILKYIMADEYQERMSSSDTLLHLNDTLLKRLSRAEFFDSLTDIWFTGDGVMFVFGEGEMKILFRPSGTEPKLKAYGFGSAPEKITENTWACSYCANIKGTLPDAFTRDKDLMELWGSDGTKAVDKAFRMQIAWEQYGLVIDPDELSASEIAKLKETRGLVRTFNPPDNHLEMVNQWLKTQGLTEVKIDLSKPQAMAQKDIIALMEALPEAIYADLGKTKAEVLEKEKTTEGDVKKDGGAEYSAPVNALMDRLQADNFEAQLKAAAGNATHDAVAKIGNGKLANTVFEWDAKKQIWINRAGWNVVDLAAIKDGKAGRTVDDVLKDGQALQGKYAILFGMGGSGLSVQLVKDTFSNKASENIFSVRTTDPTAILQLLLYIAKKEGSLAEALRKTDIVLVSKSATTPETVAHRKYFEAVYKAMNISSQEHLWFLTDSISPWGIEAQNNSTMRQRELQLNGREDVGGRFTAPGTNVFLFPMAIVAPELVKPILDTAVDMNKGEYDQFIRLGALLFHAAKDLGQNKLTMILPSQLRTFGEWVEQLIEETTGKGGKGISIFYNERDLDIAALKDVASNDRIFLRINLGSDKPKEGFWKYLEGKGYPTHEITLNSLTEIGGLQLGFERAVVAFSYLWDICAVDQPAVQAYKIASKEMETMIEKAGGDAVKVLNDLYTLSSKKGAVTVYYDPLIKMGAVSQVDIETQVRALGSTMDDPAAVYAAVVRLLKDKFSAESFTMFGTLTDGLKKTFNDMHSTVFTHGLKMPSKLNEGPNMNHSVEQLKEDGPDIFFSTFFLPLQSLKAKDFALLQGIPDFSGLMIKAQAMGTVKSMIDRKRKVILITADATAEGSEKDMAEFFGAVSGYLEKSGTFKDKGEQADFDDIDTVSGLEKVPESVAKAREMIETEALNRHLANIKKQKDLTDKAGGNEIGKDGGTQSVRPLGQFTDKELATLRALGARSAVVIYDGVYSENAHRLKEALWVLGFDNVEFQYGGDLEVSITSASETKPQLVTDIEWIMKQDNNTAGALAEALLKIAEKNGIMPSGPSAEESMDGGSLAATMIKYDQKSKIAKLVKAAYAYRKVGNMKLFDSIVAMVVQDIADEIKGYAKTTRINIVDSSEQTLDKEKTFLVKGLQFDAKNIATATSSDDFRRQWANDEIMSKLLIARNGQEFGISLGLRSYVTGSFSENESEFNLELALALRQVVRKVASEKNDGGGRNNENNPLGGVAFQALPMTETGITPQILALNPGVAIPAAQLDSLWREIRIDAVKDGGMPCLKIARYIDAVRNDPARLKAVAAYVAAILNKEEEEAIATSSEMKEVLKQLG